MKCSQLSFVFLAVAQLSVALFVPESNGLVARQNNKSSGNRGNNQNGGNNNQNGGNSTQNGGNNNQNGGNNNQNGGNSTQNGGGNNNGTTGNGGNDSSLTLNPSVIQNINGKGQAAGEADSLVSNNNFIDFCVGKTITNGKQVQGGSCNPTPMGDIPSVDNMPSCKFASPPNNGNIAANTAFTITLNTKNMQTGSFTNADNTYFGAPQQLNQGQIVGHNHVVVEAIQSLDSTQPTNPRVFAFFKGLNGAAVNGQLSADVTNGLAAGSYRVCSITSSSNHQSVAVPVAQRGSVDDCSYFTVGGNNNGTGGNNNQNGGNNNQNGGNGNQNGGNNGQNGRRNGRNGRRYERRFFASY